MRKQHHFYSNAEDGVDAWDVDRLVSLSEDLPVRTIEIPEKEIDEVYWFNDSRNRPTVRRVIDHIRLIEACDLSFPIILGADGRIMDGMHRIAKAVLEGRTTIDAVQFVEDPEPDYRNCEPGVDPRGSGGG